MDGATPIAWATALVPPSKSMICEAVINGTIAENATTRKGFVANCVIDRRADSIHPLRVLDSKQLLDRLQSQGVKNADIARALKIDPARVTEMKKGQRRLLLDEAVKLVAAFELESGSTVEPLHPAIPRLIARHIARTLELDTDGDDPRMLELVADLQAFSRFVADPQVRASLDAAENFFRAMDLRRAPGAASSRKQTDLQH